MATVTLGSQFFIKEAKNYSSWSMAFWRELFQNSIDARARNIVVEVEDLPGAGQARVSFADDGVGMDRATLEGVFFSLGESTKNAVGESIGGFGKARIVLCFAQADYEIRTGCLRASGSGGEYEIEEGLPHLSGCRFAITVDYAGLGSSYQNFRANLNTFLALCQIPSVNVSVNGEAWSTWTYKKRKVTELTFGDVHANKSAHPNLRQRLLVRVNGVLMYQRGIRADALVVVELDAAKSREVLLSNRDSLSYQYERELDNFVQMLAADTTSALRQRPEEKDVLAGEPSVFVPKSERARREREGRRMVDAVPDVEEYGDGSYASQEDLASEGDLQSLAALVREPLARADGALSTVTREVWVEQPDRRVSDDDAGEWVAGRVWHQGLGEWVNATVLADHGVRSAPKRDWLTRGMIRVNKAQDARVRAASHLYHPDRWTGGKGSRRRKLLAQWVVACEAALDAFCEIRGRSDITWRWGWYFDDLSDAACQAQDDGSHALLLNPVHTTASDAGAVGNMRFGLRDMASHVRLLTLACHEVTHVAHDWHDESFSSLFTEVVALAMVNLAAVHRDMLSAA
jgi:hypothetical protein